MNEQKLHNNNQIPNKTTKKYVDSSLFVLMILVVALLVIIVGSFAYVTYTIVDNYQLNINKGLIVKDFVYYWNIVFLFSFFVFMMIRILLNYKSIMHYNNVLPNKIKKLNSNLMATVFSFLLSIGVLLAIHFLAKEYASDKQYWKITPNIGKIFFLNHGLVSITIIYGVMSALLLFFYIKNRSIINKYEYTNVEASQSHLTFWTVSSNIFILILPIIPAIIFLIAFWKKIKGKVKK